MQRARWVGLLAVCAVLAGISLRARADTGDPVKDQHQQVRDVRTQARAFVFSRENNLDEAASGDRRCRRQ